MSRTKTRQKTRTSSSDQTPGDDSDFIVAIQESLAEIKDSMVKNSDIKDIVGEIITGLKHDLKEEISSEIKNDLKVSITAQVQTEFETKIEKQYRDFDFKTKELADGFNLDFDTLREKLHAQAQDIRYLQDKLNDCQVTSQSALSLANQN